MLELKNINVSFRSERQDKIFGHTRQQVLFDVSLAVKEGTCLGILGESGSGKSTMGRVLCGLLKPDSGEAVLDGVSVYASRAGRRNLQNKLSIVFQDSANRDCKSRLRRSSSGWVLVPGSLRRAGSIKRCTAGQVEKLRWDAELRGPCKICRAGFV